MKFVYPLSKQQCAFRKVIHRTNLFQLLLALRTIMIQIGDLVQIDCRDDVLLSCLKAYGKIGVVIEIDESITPERLRIMFPDQILSLYSDTVEVVSHT